MLWFYYSGVGKKSLLEAANSDEPIDDSAHYAEVERYNVVRPVSVEQSTMETLYSEVKRTGEEIESRINMDQNVAYKKHH